MNKTALTLTDNTIDFLSLTPLLDYRIQSGISYLVRTDYLLIELIIFPYLGMVKQW